MDVRRLYSIEWKDVGVHPTPAEMVAEFASVTAAAVAVGLVQGAVVSVLDACAGDGRLGKAVCVELLRAGYMPRLVMLDTRECLFEEPKGDYETQFIVGNILNYGFVDKFDLVVSNPPYEQLNVERADELGLVWTDVRFGGRNLYGMAMLACLRLCKIGGICSFIAPQGWLRNVLSKELREIVASKVSVMRIFAFQNRKLFPNVVQDTAIQLMKVKSSGEPKEMSITISYDRAAEENISLPAAFQRSVLDLPRVRIGPLVWNRHDPSAFVQKGGYRVLYGGNVSIDGVINWSNPRYKERRRILKSSVPISHVSRAPYIGIKRVMRGGPGAWKADLVAELCPGQECVAENHVIMVELPPSTTRTGVDFVVERLKSELERRHKDHGHPNLSVGLVREVIAVISPSDWIR